MRKDLEDWLRGIERPWSAAEGPARRKPVVPEDAGEWDLPVAFFLDLNLPLALEKEPFPAAAAPEEETERAEDLPQPLPPESVRAGDGVPEPSSEEPPSEEDAGLEQPAGQESLEQAPIAQEPTEQALMEQAPMGQTPVGLTLAGQELVGQVLPELAGLVQTSGPLETDSEEPAEPAREAETEAEAETEEMEIDGLAGVPAEAGPEKTEDAGPEEVFEEPGESGLVEPLELSGPTDGGAPPPGDGDGGAGDAGLKSGAFLPAGRREWDGNRFDERLRNIELTRRLASRQRYSGFWEKYGRYVAWGAAVFFIVGSILLMYNHLRRNSYSYLMENAKTLYEREMYGDSLKAYWEVSLLYPDRIDPFLGVARVSERMGRIEEAVEAYKCVLDLEPFYDFAQNELTRVSLVLEKGEQEEEPGGGAGAREYEHATQMGAIALLSGNYDEASRYFSDALALRSDDASVWVDFADARAGLGDAEEAVQSLKTALSRDPANEEAKSKLAGLEKAAAEKEKETQMETKTQTETKTKTEKKRKR